MEELQELRNEILMLRNYGGINKEEELSLLSKLNSVKEQLILSGVVGQSEQLPLNKTFFNKARSLSYTEFSKWINTILR